MNADVTVVGGGMIGLACACLFAREGFQVVVVDAGLPPSRNASDVVGRVSALNCSTQHILMHVDVWESIQGGQCTPYQTMRVWDSDSTAQIQFEAQEEGVPTLGHIVENSLVTASMLDRLRQNYHADLRYGEQVIRLESGKSGNEPTIRLDLEGGKRITSRLVVAADGAKSTLRTLAGIDWVEQDFHQDAVVATLEISRSHHQTAYQVFTPQGPIAMLPLMGQYCSLVWSRDRDDTDDLLALETHEFCRRLEQYFQPDLGFLRLIGDRRRFPLASQHAKTYHHSRLVLVGDAAHSIHPLAGQGANLGMLDAAALVETVAAARDAGKSIGNHSVLRRYERWRWGHNSMAIQVMKGFKNLFGSRLPALRISRAAAFRIAGNVRPLKHSLVQYALGIRGDLPKACYPINKT